MQPRLALLPLDDRPSSYLFPQRIAQIAGLDLRLPPRSILGRFHQPGSPTAAAEWLKQTSLGADGLLIAAEMLAYGGLFASRYPDPPLETALAHLAILEELHQAQPTCPIYVASLVMRTTISASSAQAAPAYEALMRYSELQDLVEVQGQCQYAVELKRLRQDIPAGILQSYLAARQRNHQVNQRLLEYRAQGIIQELIFLQDDSRPAGPQRLEQIQLRQRSVELGLQDPLILCPGGDEGGLDLLARWMNREAPPAFEVHVTADAGLDTIADYEDRPLRETLAGHLQAANVRSVDQAGDLIFWVHTPSTILEVESMFTALRRSIQTGHWVAIADVRFPNGSDPALMERLCAAGLMQRLAAYAGWNTAGNTLGASIAQASAWLAAVRRAPNDAQRRAQTQFLWERTVDDWGYQRVMRQPLEERLRKEGADILDLGPAGTVVEAEIRQNLTRWAEQTWRGGQWKGPCPPLTISLPWKRTFEVEVRAGERGE